MHAVSTPANEIRGSVSPDGTHIAWGSPDRAGGPGGWDIWIARREGGRWTDPRPASFDGTAKDFDPMFSANGRWLYFFSNRPGGRGGDDLYRVAVDADGSFGDVQSLGDGVNTPGDEWAPTPSRDGQHLLFASDGLGGAGRHDLFVARWNGHAFVDPKPVPGHQQPPTTISMRHGRRRARDRVRTLHRSPTNNRSSCSSRAATARVTSMRSRFALSFNTPDGWTLGPAIDWNKPNELLVSGAAKAPHAGKLDLYRMAAPRMEGRDGCL
jgi:hypothetical protein